MKKYGKVSKGVLITIIIIAILFIFAGTIFGIFTVDKMNKEKQEKILSDEFISMYTSQKVDTEIKTTGKFAKLESAIKTYYTEYVNTSKDLIDIYSQNLLNNSLTADNISNDGPEFKTTKANINKIEEIAGIKAEEKRSVGARIGKVREEYII